MSPELQHRVIENLIFEWARAIDEDRVEDIVDLMLDTGTYKVQSRFNHDRQLPMAIIDCQSAAQLRDRIRSMRIANVYEPHHYRHMVSGVQVIASEDQTHQVRSNYLIIRTMDLDGDMKIFSTGQCRDEIIFTDNGPSFKSRHFLYDSRFIETLLVIPI